MARAKVLEKRFSTCQVSRLARFFILSDFFFSFQHHRTSSADVSEPVEGRLPRSSTQHHFKLGKRRLLSSLGFEAWSQIEQFDL